MDVPALNQFTLVTAVAGRTQGYKAGQSLRSVLRDSGQKSHPFNDVSIQADIRVAEPTTYESEDELMGMGRRKQLGRSKRGTPLYSKEDIREQYCINDKQLHGLEDIQGSGGLFGCLSSYHVDLSDSSCSSRSPGLLSVCVRRKVPSDENLAELCRRPPHDYAPFPRWPRYLPHDEAVYFRRRPKSLCNDPHNYAWMTEDEEAIRMEHPRSIRPDEYEMFNNYPRRGPHYMSYSSEYLVGRHMPCPAHPHLPPPPPPPAIPTMPHRTKHVSFARSHTLTSFDDAVVSIGSGVSSCSQERLIDGKKSMESLQEPQKVVVMEKVKRAPMKTQATQTEVCLGRKPLPPNYLTLSPRTVHRVRMVSQGAQTNGDKSNRRLMKSFSEVGQFGVGAAINNNNVADTHEPLQRTQSEEPPRSPFLPTSPKEILIDFEPLERRGRKRLLGKTVSDGEILEAAREKEERGDGATQSDCEACYQNTSIIDEPSEKRSASSAFSGSDTTSPVKQLISADSQEEEFHENLIYGSGLFRKQSTAEDADSGLMSMADPKATPTTKIQSPFASSDSLNTRDHSDGIWNESQTTILHADSDNNGAGTGVSCSDLSSSLTPSAAIMSLTPSSRRKHLLMLQHQQRSSMDTEALDAEDLDIEQPPLSPRMRGELMQTVPVVAVTTPTHDKSDASKPVIKNTLPYFKTRIEQSLSPCHRPKRRSPDLRAPEPDNQKNDMLARSDSGKTNTDMSETSTTTEDYATATENNSGTESSSKLLRGDSGPTNTATSVGVPSATGSSFESGSSLYSFARGDTTEEIQQVPCSPPPIAEEKEKNNEFTEERRLRDADSVSGDSSSSGSYSVDGSSGEKQLSDPSGACSSPGEYESPVEEQAKSSRKSWTEEEISEAKKGFKLELSPQKEQASSPPTVITPQRGVVYSHRSPNREVEQEVPKRSKGKTQSPVKSSGKHTPTQVVVSNGMGGVSSEDSSGECACGRQRRTRESPRRKSGGRSPTSHNRTRKRSNSGDENSRRRGSIAAKSPSPVAPEEGNTLRTTTRLYPGHETARSPGGSPSRRCKPKGITSPDAARLKALSAESLRSVSPGSDSVFYSEHSSATATLTEQPTCHHCGRNVDTSPLSAGAVGNGENNSNERNGGARDTIVQPPAGFADSPRPAHRDRATTPAPRLYKKADKRFRSEERRHQARVHAEAVRAKSEERGREEKKEKVRPLTRSTDASMEKLRCSPSSLCSDDDDYGVYADSYYSSTWVYIGDNEEMQVWQGPLNKEEQELSRRDSVDSTGSEREFQRRYQAITHRMVHRKSSLEMYKRLASKSFADCRNANLRVQLEDLFKAMLVVWAKETQACSFVSGQPDESDKRVLVRRVSGEFGFRIHGSRPVVVSAIEPSTPAESSGLEVGDIVISVNKINVLDASHSDVVKLAHGGSDTLELEVASTSSVFSMGNIPKPVLSGTLLRLSSSSSKTRGTWVPRNFVLNQDHCLYYYKTEMDSQPVGAVNLAGYSVSCTPDSGCPHSFKLSKKGALSLHLAANSSERLEQWLNILSSVTAPVEEPWLDENHLKMPPTRIQQPECAGTLCTLVHHRGKAWRRRFCILKNACLYFYSDINADSSSGMACLQGYRVQSSASGAKRFAFELVPPEPSLRHFYFYTDTEMDKKRWLAALEYSIDRWIKES